jgi:hypothetical protein
MSGRYSAHSGPLITEDMHSGPYSTWTTCHRVQAEYQRYYHILASCFSNEVGEFYLIYE